MTKSEQGFKRRFVELAREEDHTINVAVEIGRSLLRLHDLQNTLFDECPEENVLEFYKLNLQRQQLNDNQGIRIIYNNDFSGTGGITFSSTPQSPPTQSPWIKINDDDTELFASCCALKYRRILDNFNKKKLDNNRNSKPSP